MTYQFVRRKYGWQFVFACRIRVVSTNKYSTIWVNIKLTRLLNGSRFLNPNTTCLLNQLVVSTRLSDFVETKQKYTNFSTKL